MNKEVLKHRVDFLNAQLLETRNLIKILFEGKVGARTRKKMEAKRQLEEQCNNLENDISRLSKLWESLYGEEDRPVKKPKVYLKKNNNC